MKKTKAHADKWTGRQTETEGESERATRQTAKTYANCMV